MKKQTEKKLSLGMIKVADLSKNNTDRNANEQRSAACESHPFACMSQGAPVCSEGSCLF